MNYVPETTLILSAVWKGAVFLTLSLVVAFLLRRRSAAMQSLFFRVTLVGLLLLSVMGVSQPIWHFNVADSALFENSQTGNSNNSMGASVKAVPVENSLGAITASKPLSIPVASTFSPKSDVSPTNRSVVIPWLAAIWMVGAAVCFGRFMIGWIRLYRLRAQSSSAPTSLQTLVTKLSEGIRFRGNISIRTLDSITAPLSFGVLRPTIIFPENHNWNREELHMALTHELAHIRRWDSAFLWIAEFCRALLWFNPLVWVVLRKMRMADERAADDAVLCNGSEPQSYANLLLALARKSVSSLPSPSAASAMAQPSTIRVRIERVLDDQQYRRAASLSTILFFALLALSAAVIVGGATTAAAQENGESKSETEEKAATTSTETKLPFKAVPVADPSQEIIEKLRKIELPSIEFSEVTLTEAITSLRKLSRELDVETEDPEKRGINFVIKKESDSKISLNLRKVPMIVALKAVTDLAGMRYRVEPFAIVITPLVEDSKVMHTRVWMAPPTFMSNSAAGPKGTAKDALTAAGVTFPDGASAFFDASRSQLIVRNTASNLDMVQTYVEQAARASNTTLAVSVEIYALDKKEALKMLAEHGEKSDVSSVVESLRERINGESVRLVATPHSVTRSGQAAPIESGERIDYVSAYVDKNGRDEPVTRSVFSGTMVEVEPILGADGFTTDVRIAVAVGLGEPKIEKRKILAPVSGKEVEVSSVRLNQSTFSSVTTAYTGQTKLIGVMNSPAHIGEAEAHVVFLTIARVESES